MDLVTLTVETGVGTVLLRANLAVPDDVWTALRLALLAHAASTVAAFPQPPAEVPVAPVVPAQGNGADHPGEDTPQPAAEPQPAPQPPPVVAKPNRVVAGHKAWATRIAREARGEPVAYLAQASTPKPGPPRTQAGRRP